MIIEIFFESELDEISQGLQKEGIDKVFAVSLKDGGQYLEHSTLGVCIGAFNVGGK